MPNAYLFIDDKWRGNKCQMFCFMQWLRFVWNSCITEIWTNCMSNFEGKQNSQSEVWPQNKIEKNTVMTICMKSHTCVGASFGNNFLPVVI